MGQSADLLDLQRVLNRSEKKLGNAQQQNVSRWAVYQACVFLKEYSAEYDALRDAMAQAETVPDCFKAIELARYPFLSGEFD